MWFCPPSLVFLQRCLVSASGTVQMQTQISRVTLALYHDHRVCHVVAALSVVSAYSSGLRKRSVAVSKAVVVAPLHVAWVLLG